MHVKVTRDDEEALAAIVAQRIGFDAEWRTMIERLSPPEFSSLALFVRERRKLGLSHNQAGQATISRLHSDVAWHNSGRPIFRVADGLCALLALTEIEDDVPPLPFVGFRVQLPERALAYDAAVWARQLDVSDLRDRGVRFLCAHVHLSSGQTLIAQLPWDDLSARPGDSSEYEGLVRRIGHFVRGFANYICSRVEPLVPENAAGIARDGKRGGAIRPPVFVLGKTIKVSREMLSASRQSDTLTPRWRVQNRYTVMGHWRWQPIGHRLPEGHEGPEQRRRTWIKPHWKGPEGATAWQHTYDVACDDTKSSIQMPDSGKRGTP